jgi:RimK family alpha-L-glutamate ligase
MYKIGIVTSSIDRDWASQQLLHAAEELSAGGVVDPMGFELCIDGQCDIFVHGKPVDDYDAYIVRGLSRRGEIDYQYEVLELLLGRGKLVMNTPLGLSTAESKALTTFLLREAGLPVPRTAVTQDLDEARRTAAQFGTFVVKPLYGSYGVGIELVTPETGPEMLMEFMQHHGVAYIQEYIPNEGRDIRAFVVGDDIPAAMYRIAADGQWKTNVHQGASCQPCALTPPMREMCLEAARIAGLDYTGVDIIEGPDGPVIIELNGAPSWYGLSETTDRNMAADIVNYALRKLDQGKAARQPVAASAL